MKGLLRETVILFIGGLLGWLGNYYFYEKGEKANILREEEITAQLVVHAFSPLCPIKDSREFNSRVKKYLDALRKAKADGRGAPAYRSDCSIGVDWSLTLNESPALTDSP